MPIIIAKPLPIGVFEVTTKERIFFVDVKEDDYGKADAFATKQLQYGEQVKGVRKNVSAIEMT